MKHILTIAIFSASAMAFCQAPQPDPSPYPKISASTQIAIHTIRAQAEKIQAEQTDLEQAIKGVDADVKKEIPGWWLNPKTITIEKVGSDSPAHTAPPTPKSGIPHTLNLPTVQPTTPQK